MAKFDNHMIFRLVLIVLAVFVLFALINYYNSKQSGGKKASFSNSMPSTAPMMPPYVPQPQKQSFRERFVDQPTAAVASSVNPAEEKGDELYRTVDFNSQKLPSDCFPKDRLTADDLLPKDAANSKWSQVATNGQGELANQNFLTAGFHTGINSVSGSLRNANLQVRSEPPNPKINVSPWMTSTISGDNFRRPLEIGGDC